VRVRGRRDDAVRDDRDPDLRAHAHGLPDSRPVGPEADHRADHLRAVRGRLVRDQLAAVRRLGHAGLRRAGLRAAPCRLSDRAAGPGPGAGRPDGKGVPARARAVRRRAPAVLHAPDLRGAVDHDRRGHRATLPGGAPHVVAAGALAHVCRGVEMSTVRLGIVMNGVTGRMGTNQHLVRSICAIRAQGGVALADGRRVMPDPILVGRNPDKLAQLARAHGVARWTTDLTAALADRDDTLYFDSASTGLRPQLIEQAIAAGKHIYTEKPVAPTLAQALSLCAAARRAGVKHGVVQDKLWLPGLLKLRMLIASGFFGRILSVRGEFGYWVFEGDWQPAQRPSWNYR